MNSYSTRFCQDVFVINLELRTDRRAAMRKQLSQIGWRATFFPAIRPDNAAGFPSVGARGCFLSHLAVLKNALQAGLPQLVILEDDLNFADDFAARWGTAIAPLETEPWSIFYPAHAFAELPAGLSRIAPQRGVEATHFMVINGPAIASIVAGLETILSRPPGHPLGGPMHVDGAYSTLRHQDPALVTYVHSPPFGYQRASRTDVGDLKWFDRVGMLAPLVGVARKLRARP
jgi:glycosyl transferase family 25